MMRYHPAVQYLANVKDCYRFDFNIGHDVTQWRENWTFAGSYAADPNGGGVLLDLCHELDMAHTIVGALDIHSVSAVNHTDYPTIDFSTAIGASTQSAHGQIAMDYLSQISTRQTTLWGRSHNHYFDFAKDSYTRANADSSETLDLSIDRQKMFQNAMSDFLTVVAGGKPNNPLAPILSNEMASCHAICKAYENRTFVATLKGKI
jgi:predicted dehydrogenase